MSNKASLVVIATTSFCLAALVLVDIWKPRTAPDQPQVTANAAAAALTTPSPLAAPAQAVAQAVNCEKYDGLMRKCVSDFQLVRTTLDAANAPLAPPSEERDFEALSAANEVALVGTCIDILMWQISKDIPGVPDPTFDIVKPYMQCQSTRRAMEYDARLLEQWHIVQTRSAERCGLATPCEACKKFGRSAQSCVGVATPEGRLKILKKGVASRTILSLHR